MRCVLLSALACCAWGQGSIQYQTAKRPEAGAVTRSVQDKLNESLSVKDFGARGDGVTDDTAAIQAAVTAACLAGNVRLTWPQPPAFYSMLGGATGIDCVNVVFDGGGSLLRVPAGTADTPYVAWPDYGQDSFLRLVGGSHVTIENFTMDQNLSNRTGHLPAESQNSCILISSGASDVLITHNSLLNCMTDGVITVFGSTGISSIPTSIRITDNRIDQSRRNGISVVGGQAITLQGNRITNTGTVQGLNPQAAIDIEPESSAVSDDIEVYANVIQGGGGPNAFLISGTGTSNLRIHDNTLTGSPGQGLRFLNYIGSEMANRNVTVGPGNVFDSNFNCGVYVNAIAIMGVGRSHLVDTIFGNTFSKAEYGVCAFQVDTINIQDNQFRLNKYVGAYVDDFLGIVFRDNFCWDNSTAGPNAGSCAQFTGATAPSFVVATENVMGNSVGSTTPQSGINFPGALGTGIAYNNTAYNLFGSTPPILGTLWAGAVGNRVVGQVLSGTVDSLGGLAVAGTSSFDGPLLMSGGTDYLNRPANHLSGGVTWSHQIESGDGIDVFQTGMTGINYTTRGGIGWLGNSMGYIYYPQPHPFRIGTGGGTLPAIDFEPNGTVLIGNKTDNGWGDQLQVTGVIASTGGVRSSAYSGSGNRALCTTAGGLTYASGGLACGTPPGPSAIVTVRNSAGTGTCTITFTSGLFVSSTC